MESKLLRFISAVFFCSFSFCFLFFYQVDVMTVTQHIASHGKTFYNPIVGAILITVILQLLQNSIDVFVKIPNRVFALTYFPPIVLLSLISSIRSDVEYNNFAISQWWWILLILFPIYIFIVFFVKRYEPYAQQQRNIGVFSQSMRRNLFILFFFFFFVGYFSNNDPYFHKRAKIEHLIDQRQYTKALSVVKTLSHTDSVISMLTIYAAARSNKLTNHLFNYPLVGGSHVMRPLYVHSYLQPDSIILKNTRLSANYQLMGFLLDRNLSQFIRYLPQYYPSKSVLPRYYKEAVRIYSLHLKDSIPSPPYPHDSYYQYYFNK